MELDFQLVWVLQIAECCIVTEVASMDLSGYHLLDPALALLLLYSAVTQQKLTFNKYT